MHYTLNFGKYKGKTFEWVFFNDSSYAKWLYSKGILRTRHDYDFEEEEYFNELYSRASHLTGICRYCDGNRTVTRKALSLCGKDSIACLCCDDCVPLEGQYIYYEEPMLFIADILPTKLQAPIARKLLANYLDTPLKKVTQATMEKFFREDRFFVNAEADFFINVEIKAKAK